MEHIRLYEDFNTMGAESDAHIKQPEYTNSNWSVGKYLVNKDVKNMDTVKAFIKHFKLSQFILDVWEIAKEKGVYPLEITNTNILYTTADNEQLIINLSGDKITNMFTKKVEYKNGCFVSKIVKNLKFSIENFKKLI